MVDDVSLREYIEAQIQSLRKQVEASITASDRALAKAELATDKRFDSVNEFRAALADQATNFLPRQEYTVQHKALMDKTDMNNTRIAQLEAQALGRSTGQHGIGAIVLGIFMGLSTLCSIIAVAVALFHRW